MAQNGEANFNIWFYKSGMIRFTRTSEAKLKIVATKMSRNVNRKRLQRSKEQFKLLSILLHCWSLARTFLRNVRIISQLTFMDYPAQTESRVLSLCHNLSAAIKQSVLFWDSVTFTQRRFAYVWHRHSTTPRCRITTTRMRNVAFTDEKNKYWAGMRYR